MRYHWFHVLRFSTRKEFLTVSVHDIITRLNTAWKFTPVKLLLSEISYVAPHGNLKNFICQMISFLQGKKIIKKINYFRYQSINFQLRSSQTYKIYFIYWITSLKNPEQGLKLNLENCLKKCKWTLFISDTNSVRGLYFSIFNYEDMFCGYIIKSFFFINPPRPSIQ